jgi:rfaE bifunctional protein nucleotidyltransferase chain/domain
MASFPHLDTVLKKLQGKKIVFTNGCFDILHRGHVTYLNQARACGEALVVGINSDASVRQLKGEARPVVAQEDRKFLLENLRCVDAVFVFDSPTPLELIMAVRPHVLVKGGDWKIEQIVGAKEVLSWDGEVRSLTFVQGYSTTNLINKILSL